MAKLHATLAALCLTAALPAVADGPPPTSSNEAQVLVGFIDQQASAMELARVCVERTSQPELRELCGRVLRGSSRIETLQNWLDDWHGLAHTPVVPERDRQVVARLAAPAGRTFETELMASLLAQRYRSLQRCAGASWRPELLGLCQESARQQAAEIETLSRWTCEWYGHCRGSEGARGTASTSVQPGSAAGNPASTAVNPRGD